ncbi:phosphatase PAP2 family protein [Streptomyces sp. Y1]|uniref:Phosphatase PAP2 family protein n=1 Tax=Streptomyces sp. Y1 TaxID=3238634 RepID=A0AB39TG11_9ACTN
MGSPVRSAPGRRAPSRALLPPPPRRWLGLVAALAALVVLVLGVRYAGEGEPGTVDDRIGTALYGPGAPWRSVAHALDALGEPVGATALVATAVAGCLLLRRPRAAVFTVTGVALAVGAATLLKHLAGRTIHGDGNLSYPSGHTAFLTAFALTVAVLATNHRGSGRPLLLGAALLAGAVMGWAQVVLGAHYPTDVLGGWCTALAVVPATAWLVDRTADRLTGAGTDTDTGADTDTDTHRRQPR